jgi:ribosomal protein L11 methylase PrmA
MARGCFDVGCGTGALSSTLANMTRAAKIVGIDPSAAFIQAARSQITDPRVTIELGDAQSLPICGRVVRPMPGVAQCEFYPGRAEGSERDAPSDEVRRRRRDHNVGRQPC